MFLVSVGFWNFLGAGVFGFLINLPVVSYYEIGTALTANHGHAAMMGVYGMLAVGLALFCIRYMIPEERWSERAAKISFWSLNIGLAWMVFATLFPLGLLQLYESVNRVISKRAASKFLTSDRTLSSNGCGCRETLCSSPEACFPFCTCAGWECAMHGPPRRAEQPETALFAEVSES